MNTLPSGHTEMRDCYPMRCWRVTHFYIFLYDVLHMRLSARLAHFLLQGYRQLNEGCRVSSYKQTNIPVLTPIFRTIRMQQKDHSFRYFLCFPSIAIMAVRRNALKEDNILCELYSDTRSDVSDYTANKV
jgi:hypothetical protein